MGQPEFHLSFEHDGTVYNMSPEDFTAYDDLQVQKAIGVSLTKVFLSLRVEPSLFGIAALLWRYRVNDGENDLTYEDVAKSFPYSTVKTLSTKPRDDADPKA